MNGILSVGGWLWEHVFIFGPLFIAAVAIAALAFGWKFLDFIKSPAGQICIVLGLLYAASSFGYSVAEKECVAERARIEAAATLRDKDQEKIAGADDTARALELERQVKEHVTTIASYEKLLASRPNAACLLTADDLR